MIFINWTSVNTETWSQNAQLFPTVTNFPNVFRLVDMVAELGMYA